MTPAVARPHILPFACLGLAASLISLLGTGAQAAPTSLKTPAQKPQTSVAMAPAAALTTAAAVTAASPASAAHPYSDPTWSPLRTPARVNCVFSNCPGPYHGYWAIDFIGSSHTVFDPLYAAGSGIFHIKTLMGRDTCGTPGKPSSGTVVWIDHGGGRTTQYHHLYSVLAKEGQLVTPATQIGQMGHNGNGAPCKANYLHMEYRIHGIKGPRVAPSAMQTCVGTSRVSMPSFLGYRTWNSVPTNQDPKKGSKPNIFTPRANNACLATTSRVVTPARPGISARRGVRSATIKWGTVPAGVNHSLVTIVQWHPTLHAYGTPVYRTIAGRGSTTKFTGLVGGRPYRFRVASHNGSGYSAWSASVKVIPAK